MPEGFNRLASLFPGEGAVADFVKEIVAKITSIPSLVRSFATAIAGDSGATDALRSALLVHRTVAATFAYNDVGLLTGNFNTGIRVTTDDIFLNASYLIEEYFNGTTPKFDLGMFQNGDTKGYFYGAGFGGQDLSKGNLDFPDPAVTSLKTDLQYSVPNDLFTYSQGQNRGKFVKDGYLYICVSQSGQPGGADPISTQGRATVIVEVLSPLT